MVMYSVQWAMPCMSPWLVSRSCAQLCAFVILQIRVLTDRQDAYGPLPHMLVNLCSAEAASRGN